jgi:quinol monooxygenase YgiN
VAADHLAPPNPASAASGWTRPQSGAPAPTATGETARPHTTQGHDIIVKKSLYAEFTAREGAEDEVARLLRDYAQRVRVEEGNLAFDVYTRASDPRAFWIFEAYRDETAFQTHLKAPYGAPFNAALAPLIEEDASVLTFLDQLG